MPTSDQIIEMLLRRSDLHIQHRDEMGKHAISSGPGTEDLLTFDRAYNRYEARNDEITSIIQEIHRMEWCEERGVDPF